MSEILKVLSTNQSSDLSEKYFSFQIKGWTNFDPVDKMLANVAECIERGDGFLMLVEVLRVEDEMESIDDKDVRGCFENLLAATRLIRNVNELPARVKAALRAALQTEDAIAPKSCDVRARFIFKPGAGFCP